MAAFEVIALDTATPQLRAPGAADTYTFPRAVELPLGTANGVLYLNGSKVVTSGSGLTFDGTNLGVGAAPTGFGKLDVRNGTNFRVLINGIAGYGSNAIAGINDVGSETHLGLAGTPIAFYVQAAEQMRLTSTGLGIGTNNPGAKLHVVGSTYRQNSVTGSFGFTINTTSATTTLATLFGGSSFAIQTAASGTNQLLLDASGNLGLGVTPSAWSTTDSVRALQLNGGSFYVFGANRCFVGQNVFVASGGIETYVSTAAASTYRQFQGAHSWYNASSGTAGNAISFTQAMTLTAASNLKLGGTADRATTAGTNHLDIFNGTAPVGTLANGISLYSDAGEAYVMDAAGNATLFSPHDAETNEWIFRSKHTPTGKVLKIDVERLLRFVNDHFGLDAVEEFVER
jgi:hypothetical protein